MVRFTRKELNALTWLRQKEHCGRIYNRMNYNLLKFNIENTIKHFNQIDALPVISNETVEIGCPKNRAQVVLKAKLLNGKANHYIMMPDSPLDYLYLELSENQPVGKKIDSIFAYPINFNNLNTLKKSKTKPIYDINKPPKMLHINYKNKTELNYFLEDTLKKKPFSNIRFISI